MERVIALIPTINFKKAMDISKVLLNRADYPLEVMIFEDKARYGWVKVCNMAVRALEADYYIYLADDVFPGKFWLSKAMSIMKRKDAGLVGLNGGKWDGLIADFGLVKKEWMLKNYNGDLFFNGYKSHYGDTELTMLAINDRKYAYDPKAIMMEIHDKSEYKNNKEDRDLFRNRKRDGFNGMILDKELLQAYN